MIYKLDRRDYILLDRPETIDIYEEKKFDQQLVKLCA